MVCLHCATFRHVLQEKNSLLYHLNSILRYKCKKILAIQVTETHRVCSQEYSLTPNSRRRPIANFSKISLPISVY